jgi:hypothetical protein
MNVAFHGPSLVVQNRRSLSSLPFNDVSLNVLTAPFPWFFPGSDTDLPDNVSNSSCGRTHFVYVNFTCNVLVSVEEQHGARITFAGFAGGEGLGAGLVAIVSGSSVVASSLGSSGRFSTSFWGAGLFLQLPRPSAKQTARAPMKQTLLFMTVMISKSLEIDNVFAKC